MSQKGFDYEKKAHTFMVKSKLALKADSPAGASSDKPDLILKYGDRSSPLGKGKYGVELKTDLASAGSLVIHYNRRAKKFQWGSIDVRDPETGEIGEAKEKRFLKDLGTRYNAMSKIRQNWREEPYNQMNRDKEWERLYGEIPLNERYQWDKENFSDIIVPVPSNTIEKYYNLKKTHYLNIGKNYGFYLLGSSDPMKLNEILKIQGKPLIPRWNVSNKTIMRIRVQPKKSINAMKRQGTRNPLGGQGYQFTFELQFRSVKPSPYNIAPIQSITKTSVLLSESSAVLPWGD